MRVTHIITRLILGGAQENTVASVLGLGDRPNLDIGLISGPTRGPEGSLEDSFVGRPGVLTISPHLIRSIHPWHDLLALRDLTRSLRERAPDLVHTHSGKAGILGRLAARRAGVPIIVHTVHGPSFGAFQGPLANLAFTAAERRAACWTTHFVSVSDAMTRQYLASGVGRREQFTRIFSGFRLEPFLEARNDPAVRARFGLRPEDFVVGKIARLTELKGHDDLFAIAPALVRRSPNVKFLLVGDGRWRRRFESMAQDSGLRDRFVFTGLVPPEEIPQLVGVMDILIHLSFREGLARALPQALAAARPIVSYDCDGAGEVCLEGETGFLVPPHNLEALADRIVQLSNDGALRERLGRRGQQFVKQWFPVERMIDALDALYRRLAQQCGAASRR
jgi:glycosyltransferase involved in cell wall biosynthesis